jgi:hypothetical protein
MNKAVKIAWAATIYGYEVLEIDASGQIVGEYSGSNDEHGRSNPHIYSIPYSLVEIRQFARKDALERAEELGIPASAVYQDMDIAVALDADYGAMCRDQARAAGMIIRPGNRL